MRGATIVPHVPTNVWENLFKAAFEFYQLEPWNIFSERDIFGVFDSETKRMGYVCITGTQGKIVGMLVYRGAEGLSQYRGILKARGKRSEELMFSQDCLCMQLANRREMEPEDNEVFSLLGGAKSDILWPQFRSYLPFYIPWFINEAEARYMTSVLRCSIMIIRYAVSGKIDLRAYRGKYIACYPEKSTDSSLHFQTKVEKYPKVIPLTSEPLIINESIAADQRAAIAPHGIFEADTAFFPGEIMDRERPYYVRIAITAESDSGFVFNSKTIKPEEKEHQALADAIISAISEHKILPEEIHVKKKATAAALEPLGQLLDIKITVTKNLPAVRRFVDGAKRHFMKEQKLVYDDKPSINVSSPDKAESKTGRNAPCPCGSGKKYKKCCGK